MEHRRVWSLQEKVELVLSCHAKGGIIQFCQRHSICESQYYRWRKQVHANVMKAAQYPHILRQLQHVKHKNAQLHQRIKELTHEARRAQQVRAKRGTYPAVAQRNAILLQHIHQLKVKHPFWGYRRIWAYLHYVNGFTVSKSKIYRLMKAADLLLKKRPVFIRSTLNLPHKPKATLPHQWWGIDMTKIQTFTDGWVYLVVVIDWLSKAVMGHAICSRPSTRLWIQALQNAIECRGTHPNQTHLISDNGCQPTSKQFKEVAAHLGLQQVFTSYRNPKGNADTERFIRTLKEELVWLNDWQTRDDFTHACQNWISFYNTHYPHSSLGYISPAQFMKNHAQNSQR